MMYKALKIHLTYVDALPIGRISGSIPFSAIHGIFLLYSRQPSLPTFFSILLLFFSINSSEVFPVFYVHPASPSSSESIPSTSLANDF